MKSIQAWMKKHYVFRNVFAVCLGIIGWYIGAYISEVKLSPDSPFGLWMPVFGVIVLVLPFVVIFVGPKDKH